MIAFFKSMRTLVFIVLLSACQAQNLTGLTTLAESSEMSTTVMPTEPEANHKEMTFDEALSEFTTESEKIISILTESEVNSTDSKITTTMKPESTTADILQKWKHFENFSKVFAKNSVKRLLPTLISGTEGMNISQTCSQNLFKLLIGLRDIRTWAFSFIDASGKLIDGMLGGTMANIGEFDQCLDTKAIDERRGKNYGKVLFTGQYCAIDLKPPLPPKTKYYKLNDVPPQLKAFAEGGNVVNEAAKAAQFFQFLAMRLGICVPSGCLESDIQQLIDKAVGDGSWSVRVKRCELKQENEFTPLIISVIFVGCFFGFLMLLGTILDLYYHYAQKKINSIPLKVLACFSFVSNFKKLVNTKSSSGNLSCLHGFRFLSITWIILAHTYLNVNFLMFRGLRKATIIQQDFFFQAVVNATVAVDTFFFIGGFLLCYVTINVTRELKKPFSITIYLLHRAIRIYPVYIIVILSIYLAPLMGSGPAWHDTVDQFVDACYKNWWTNLLFINNFVEPENICLPQSWYIACDMQLYVAALIVLLPLLRWPRVGLSIAGFGVVASVIGSIVMTYVNEYPPTMLFVHADHEQRISYWANAYFKPHSHAGPYCIGILTGYLLATNPKLKFSLKTRFAGWCCATACNLAVLYGAYEWNTGRDPELIETLLYSGLHRVAWALGIAWVVVNCATGQGGVVNYILSWKCWVPLGRLVYCTYLIHPIIQIASVGNTRMRLMTHHYFAVWIYFGYIAATVGVSFVASMLVEAPFIALEKLLIQLFITNPRAASSETKLQHDDAETKTEDENTEVKEFEEHGESSRM